MEAMAKLDAQKLKIYCRDHAVSNSVASALSSRASGLMALKKWSQNFTKGRIACGGFFTDKM